MDRGYDYKKFSVLVVDDEEQALKYFNKAYSNDFRVITAPSAGHALEILERAGEQVGVLITDQRMPGQSGVDLLGRVRRDWPDIIRIITTAYSDLGSAIEAVNSGGVFRYITKPWNLRELRGVLLRAMEFYLVRRERDILVREKLSVLQRMMILDRVRSFTVLAASLAFRVRYSMTALKAFFDLVPVTVSDQISDADVNWGDLWALAQQESQRIVQAVDEVLNATVESGYTFTSCVMIDELVDQEVQKISPILDERGVSIHVDIARGLPPLKADVKMIRRLICILSSRIGMMTDQGRQVQIRVRQDDAICGSSGVRCTLSGDGPAWNTEQTASLFASVRPGSAFSGEMNMDILSAFFIAHHHGGNLMVHSAAPKGPGFELLLPFDPEATQQPPLESDWLDRIFTNLEAW